MLNLGYTDLQHVLRQCDLPSSWISSRSSELSLAPKGFWRIDKGKPPEHRHTVLRLVALHNLQEKIAACGGDVAQGIEAFWSQNDGEWWILPETLRLADYDLGHDDRAREHQAVRECFGPRSYDWQLAQTAEESWRECHLHAGNLLDEIGGRTPPKKEARPPSSGYNRNAKRRKKKGNTRQRALFE